LKSSPITAIISPSLDFSLEISKLARNLLRFCSKQQLGLKIFVVQYKINYGDDLIFKTKKVLCLVTILLFKISQDYFCF